MTQLKAHEFLELQEHIRSEAAAASTLRSMAGQCQDQELRQFVESQAHTAQENVQQLMRLVQPG